MTKQQFLQHVTDICPWRLEFYANLVKELETQQAFEQCLDILDRSLTSRKSEIEILVEESHKILDKWDQGDISEAEILRLTELEAQIIKLHKRPYEIHKNSTTTSDTKNSVR